MSNNKPLSTHPAHIYRPYNDYLKSDNEAEMHKCLLDMGESFLTYLVGIMFGEYKRSGEISDNLESEFYKYSSRKPSFGVFQSFLRILSNEMNQTILADKFEKGKKYAAVSDFISHYELLKDVIDDGLDSGFKEAVESKLKGRSVGQKGLLEFFNIFIQIRNISAHPDGKAGPSKDWKNNNPKPPNKDKEGMKEYLGKMKSVLRKWPLGEKYYAFINPYMFAALTELVEDFDILSSYKPVLARMLDDKNKRGTFVLEQGGKESEMDMDLSADDLRFINTDIRYLLDPDDKLFVKLYYHAIPQLNPKVAKKIIDREKAKARVPWLQEMIHGKLADDGKIDGMEYLVLRDTAKTSSISDDHLFQLIDKVKNKLGIKDSVGTPDNKGDIFIEEKDTISTPKFNPWWLNYLAMVKNIDKSIPKGEKQQADQIKAKVDDLKKSKLVLPVSKRLENTNKKLKEKKAQKKQQVDKLKAKVDRLKKSKKILPINKKLEIAKKKLKDKKVQKAAQIKKMNKRIVAKREMRKKVAKPERKAALLEDINTIKESIEQKRNDFDNQIEEMILKIEEIENEKQQKLQEVDDQIQVGTESIEQKRNDFDVQIEEMVSKIEEIENEKQQKLQEVDDKIQILTDKDAKAGKYRQWTMHKGLWSDIGTFVNYLVDSNLNSHLEDADEESREWEMTPNNWQIGELAYTYWAKIYPSESSLRHAFHIGFSISRAWKWIGTVQHNEVKEKINQPCIVMWPSIDVKYAAKIDPDCILLKEYKRLIRIMMDENLDLLKKVGANVQCIRIENKKGDTVPLDYYLDNKNDFDTTINDPGYSSLESQEKFNLLSKFWIIDDFMKEGLISHDRIASLEKNLTIYMTLIANVIKQLNDYALEKGINKEVISGRLDQVSRLGETMYTKFEKYFVDGKLSFNDKQEEALIKFAKEIGLNTYTYQYFKSQFIFSKNYEEKENE